MFKGFWLLYSNLLVPFCARMNNKMSGKLILSHGSVTGSVTGITQKMLFILKPVTG